MNLFDQPANTMTSVEWLMLVVSEATATDVIDHRLAKKCKLTPRAAKIIAKELALVPEWQREAAIDHWLNMGWQGFKADWAMRHLNNNQRSQQRPGIIGAAMRAMENGNSRWSQGSDGQGGGGQNRRDVEHVPAVAKH